MITMTIVMMMALMMSNSMTKTMKILVMMLVMLLVMMLVMMIVMMHVLTIGQTHFRTNVGIWQPSPAAPHVHFDVLMHQQFYALGATIALRATILTHCLAIVSRRPPSP